jgi:hypothetical protein
MPQTHQPSYFPRRRRRMLHEAPTSVLFSVASAYFPSPRPHIRVIAGDGLSDLPVCQLSCLHRLAASLPSLFYFFCIRFLCFQSFAASFPKTPGWGGIDIPANQGDLRRATAFFE